MAPPKKSYNPLWYPKKDLMTSFTMCFISNQCKLHSSNDKPYHYFEMMGVGAATSHGAAQNGLAYVWYMLHCSWISLAKSRKLPPAASRSCRVLASPAVHMPSLEDICLKVSDVKPVEETLAPMCSSQNAAALSRRCRLHLPVAIPSLPWKALWEQFACC